MFPRTKFPTVCITHIDFVLHTDWHGVQDCPQETSADILGMVKQTTNKKMLNDVIAPWIRENFDATIPQMEKCLVSPHPNCFLKQTELLSAPKTKIKTVSYKVLHHKYVISNLLL